MYGRGTMVSGFRLSSWNRLHVRTQLISRRLRNTQLQCLKRNSTQQSHSYITLKSIQSSFVVFQDNYSSHALALSPSDPTVAGNITNQEPWILVELSQSFIEALHSTIGLPWWAALSISGVLLRVTLFPLFFSQVKSVQRMKNAGGDIRKLNSAVRYTRALLPGMDKVAQLKLLKLAGKGYQLIFKKHNVLFLQTGISSFIYVPAFFVMAYSAREMIRSGRFPELETGGFGPWTNLMIPDDTFLLPILASTLTYAGMEVLCAFSSLHIATHSFLPFVDVITESKPALDLDRKKTPALTAFGLAVPRDTAPRHLLLLDRFL
uniref:Cytochrome Oxidase Biogenesis (Oxa1) Family putativ n=1 Tax=Albugo laibachii Nc14 TaxID=890382 RepID=F0WQN9_9STRA|nr:Cytochrome Oxidase Biogenesis (Oxa1) Family putativ [Albugo laibachii Nc14]|eukprot:CCA23648.1 Cytochrome Oxidase Biogenesis (Oxa1) Family putativ [Albugo laibachii Nc14]